jgi:hypothetical protein
MPGLFFKVTDPRLASTMSGKVWWPRRRQVGQPKLHDGGRQDWPDGTHGARTGPKNRLNALQPVGLMKLPRSFRLFRPYLTSSDAINTLR